MAVSDLGPVVQRRGAPLGQPIPPRLDTLEPAIDVAEHDPPGVGRPRAVDALQHQLQGEAQLQLGDDHSVTTTIGASAPRTATMSQPQTSPFASKPCRSRNALTTPHSVSQRLTGAAPRLGVDQPTARLAVPPGRRTMPSPTRCGFLIASTAAGAVTLVPAAPGVHPNEPMPNSSTTTGSTPAMISTGATFRSSFGRRPRRRLDTTWPRKPRRPLPRQRSTSTSSNHEERGIS